MPDVEMEAAPEAAPMEAGPMDSSPPVDAPAEAVNDAGPTSVTVTVIGALGPESGISVVWGDATGAIVTTTTTGAAGSTTLVVADSGTSGGMITALLGTASSPSLYTITGIEAGDALVIVDYGSITNLPGGTSVDLTAVPSPLPTNTNGLVFYAGLCNGGFGFSDAGPFLPFNLGLTRQPGAQTIYSGCVGVGQFGALVGAALPAMVEANDIGNQLVGYASSKNNPLSMVDDAGFADLSLGAGTWSTATTSQTVVDTNVPTTGSRWSLYQEVANGAPLALVQRAPADGGTLPLGTYLYTGHTGYPDWVQTEVGYNPSGNSQAALALATRGPVPTADGTTTVDGTGLSTVTGITQVASDWTTPAQPQITWTTATGSLAGATGVIAYTSWAGTDPEGGQQTGEWTIVSAGTAQTSVQAPMLPASSGWTPVSTAVAGLSGVYAVYPPPAPAVGALPSYAQLRAAATLFNVQTSCIYGPLIPPLPAPGTVLVSGFGSGGCG